MCELIGKSIGASILIGLGDFALLKLGSPIGPVIFAFGLLGVCSLEQNLFTGKAGFVFEDKIKFRDLLIILFTNLIAGYLFGLLFSIVDPEVSSAAASRTESWNFDLAFFVKSLLCGIIMYVAVYMYRKGNNLGIIFGIPLFIFSGFQHSIANIITLGTARSFSWTIILAIIGNFLGSVLMWGVSRKIPAKKKK